MLTIGAFLRSTGTPNLLAITVAILGLELVASLSWGAQVVVPNILTSFPGNSQFGNPLGCVVSSGERFQQVYRGSEVGSGTITAIAFRREEALIFPDHAPITIVDVTVSLSSTSAGPDALSTTFASNVGADVVTAFAGDVTSFTSVTGPGLKPFDTVVELLTPFTFDATSGKNLLLDITVPSCPVSAISFDVANVLDDSVSVVRASNASSSTGSSNSTRGLVTQFTLNPLPPTPSTSVTLNPAEARPGEAFSLGIVASIPSGNLEGADLYVGVLLPDGMTAAFFSAPGVLGAVLDIASLAAFPIVQQLQPGDTVNEPAFLAMVLPPGVAPGTYLFFAALIRHGALADNTVEPGGILALDAKPLIISP